METQTKTIECPNCGSEIDVNALLYHQVSESLQKEFNDKLAKEKKNYESQLESLNKKQSELEEERKNYDEKVKAAIQSGMAQAQKDLEARLKAKITEEQAEQFKSLQDELNEKSSQLKEFNKAKSEIERLKREKEELRTSIEAESEKKLNQILMEEREKLQKSVQEKAELQLKQKDNLIEQLNTQLKDAQRKAEQGSMQAQGEAQELAMEDWLRQQFPLDKIVEIKKGVRGADCIQVVNTPTRQNCGTIYYESKRTKGFQNTWIEKFKQDIRDQNATIGILVTETMPNGMERAGQLEGIWVCTFPEFKMLSMVLRDSVVRISTAIAVQENKGDKMNMLYSYLTSNEFKLQIEAIVDGFTQMQTDLESEKRAMTSIWKKREKQILKVLDNTNFMYSSIKGIAGNAVPTIKLLELDPGEESHPDS